MDKDFIENNNLEKILKNYLKQENLTVDTLSKESKIKLETIKKILENNYNRPHKSTLEKNELEHYRVASSNLIFDIILCQGEEIQVNIDEVEDSELG